MNLRDIKTKQDIIDFELSLQRKTGVFTEAEDHVCLMIAAVYCYDQDGWRSCDPTAKDISDEQLSNVLSLIAELPAAEVVGFSEQIACLS